MIILNKEKIMLRGLFRGTLDILYDSYNSARIKMNSHIRTFDDNAIANTFIKQSVIGFWRMLFEILLNVYLISSLLILTSLVLCVVIVAWPLTFLSVAFTSLAENMTDDRRFQQQIDAEKAAQEAVKIEPSLDAPVTKVKSKV
jgi:hypothetical protein